MTQYGVCNMINMKWNLKQESSIENLAVYNVKCLHISKI